MGVKLPSGSWFTSEAMVGNRHAEKHGGWKSPTWQSWSSMIGRCYQPKNGSYRYYGGRGITVYEQWRGDEGFANFLADMGERPDGMTLDRKNSEGNYTPKNCQWATGKEQIANRNLNRSKTPSMTK